MTLGEVGADADVKTIKGIGPKRAALLRKVGVLTVGELAGLSSDSAGRRHQAVELGYPPKMLHSAVHLSCRIVWCKSKRRSLW